MISNHKATIGRKLWVWVPYTDGVFDTGQAFDGTVCFVRDDGTVDVNVRMHSGATVWLTSVEVHDPGADSHNHQQANAYATWMPYQKQQMDSQGAQK